jgi:hypothetical protein
MVEEVLSAGTLNRATLARQLLLQRVPFTAVSAVEWLAGMHAPIPDDPYVGLWARLQKFAHEDMSFAIEERRVVRAVMMRSALHLVTATDYRLWRRALQPALDDTHQRHCRQHDVHYDLPAALATVESLLEDEPRTTAFLETILSPFGGEHDLPCLLSAVRTHLNLVQVPPAGIWGANQEPAYALADSWLGLSMVSRAEGMRHLIIRFLGAFGPASREDLEAWSGLTEMQPALDELEPALELFRDEDGVALYDLPNAPRPDAGTPAPIRLLPRDDSLLHAHAHLHRFVPEEHQRAVMAGAGHVKPVLLVDGQVRGTWRVVRKPSGVTLVVEPLEPLPGAVMDELMVEAESLARFLSADEAVNVLIVH